MKLLLQNLSRTKRKRKLKSNAKTNKLSEQCPIGKSYKKCGSENECESEVEVKMNVKVKLAMVELNQPEVRAPWLLVQLPTNSRYECQSYQTSTLRRSWLRWGIISDPTQKGLMSWRFLTLINPPKSWFFNAKEILNNALHTLLKRITIINRKMGPVTPLL